MIWIINKQVIKKPTNKSHTKIVVTININAFFLYLQKAVSLFHAILMSFDAM